MRQLPKAAFFHEERCRCPEVSHGIREVLVWFKSKGLAPTQLSGAGQIETAGSRADMDGRHAKLGSKANSRRTPLTDKPPSKTVHIRSREYR